METRELIAWGAGGMVAGGDVHGERYQYFNLASGLRLDMDEAQARTSAAWTIGVKRSVICVNSGVAGPGAARLACVTPPVDVSREEFARLTGDDFKKRFDAVTGVPDGAEFREEGVEPAIFGWRERRGERWAAPAGKGWKLRLADGESFAKMRIRAIGDDTLTVTIEYAYQPAKEAPLTEDRQATIRPGEAFSFRRGAAAAAEALGWDLLHGGEKLFLNSSVSGPGRAGALGSNKYGALWKTITSAGDSVAYFMDEFGEAFRSPKWYRYNIDGKHNIHPNGAVYVLRAPEGDFKIQIYHYDFFDTEDPAKGSLRLRYARL
ncbi:MAG: HmuY family protein [Nitrospinae bacterium]|nr:HmuY family protein [Nitrospinota bacterium]